MGGLTSKINYGSLQDYARHFDIICLGETKLDEADEPNVIESFEGFSTRFRHRTNYKRKSGGVATFFKKEISDGVHNLERFDSDIAQFFRMGMDICGYEFILGTVYIPPGNSDFVVGDEFESLMDTLLTINEEYELPVCLVGDFNARTGRLEDLVALDPHIAEEAGLSQLENDIFVNVDRLESLNVSLLRKNSDNKCNSHGYKLVDLCKCTGVHIVNGRLGEDKNHGKLTCMGNNLEPASTVDYVIMSTTLFNITADFEVDDFDSLLSDKHCPIILTLNKIESPSGDQIHLPNQPVINVTVCDNSVHPCNQANIKVKWNADHCQSFREGFDLDVIENINKKISDLSELTDASNSIDEIAHSISQIFLDAGTQAEMVIPNTTHSKKQTKTKHTKSKPTQPWFNQECKVIRSQYLRAKRKNKKMRTSVSSEAFKNQSKNYKKTLKKAFNDFNDNLKRKLRNLRSSDPKAYWQILNGKDKSKISKVAIEVFLEHFKKINEDSTSTSSANDTQIPKPENGDLDYYFTEEEVRKSTSYLKNGKASGIDHIINEFIKHSPPQMVTLIVNFFNLILETGIVPQDWTLGIIVPIYKNKGSMEDPDNYRGITLLSCMGKLFTAILNKRLYQFLDLNKLLGEEQAGFREGYSTLDHIFVLNSLIELYLGKGRRIYAAFVDYRKAFDSIDRTSLWSKILAHGIDGKIFRIIQNMYTEVKSCLRVNNQLSPFFYSHRGVRQGENLSPLLFSIYLNDLDDVIKKHCDGLDIEAVLGDIKLHINLYVLLYADDTIILCESEKDLQKALDALHGYCNTWDLEVNISKTKIVIFSKGRVRKHPQWNFGSHIIEVKDDYIYLGTTFNYNGKYKKAITKQVAQAKRAMYSMVGKARKLGLPVDIQLHLFDSLILPILLYGCEVWGHSNVDALKSMQLSFYKHILKLNRSTPNCIVHGETGTTNIETTVQERMLNFWARTVQGKQDKISYQIYKILLTKYNSGEFQSPWLHKIHNILNSLGLSDIWISQDPVSTTWFKHTIKQKNSDISRQNWNSSINDSGWCRCYKILKDDAKIDPYLLILEPKYATPLCKFRAGNHKLPIVTGRFKGIRAENRICGLCELNLVGDEFHYLFKCPYFTKERENLLHISYSLNIVTDHQIKRLFQSDDCTEIKNLAKFTVAIMGKFQET